MHASLREARAGLASFVKKKFFCPGRLPPENWLRLSTFLFLETRPPTVPQSPSARRLSALFGPSTHLHFMAIYDKITDRWAFLPHEGWVR